MFIELTTTIRTLNSLNIISPHIQYNYVTLQIIYITQSFRHQTAGGPLHAQADTLISGISDRESVVRSAGRTTSCSLGNGDFVTAFRVPAHLLD